MFEPEAFWKQMYCIEECACGIFRTFRLVLGYIHCSQKAINRVAKYQDIFFIKVTIKYFISVRVK